jgi:hypothetical protein
MRDVVGRHLAQAVEMSERVDSIETAFLTSAAAQQRAHAGGEK